MTNVITETDVVPATITRELVAQQRLEVVATDALPVLRIARENSSILTANLPNDDPVLPGASVVIEPFYMNRTDPLVIGVWGISAKGTSDLSVRLSSSFTPGGATIELSAKGDDGQKRPATVEEMLQAAHILELLQGGKNIDSASVKSTGNAHRITRIIRRLGSRAQTQ